MGHQTRGCWCSISRERVTRESQRYSFPPSLAGGFRHGEGRLRANQHTGPRPCGSLDRWQVSDGHRHHGSLDRALDLRAKGSGFESRWGRPF